mgnify:CR=1 FL=1
MKNFIFDGIANLIPSIPTKYIVIAIAIAWVVSIGMAAKVGGDLRQAGMEKEFNRKAAAAAKNNEIYRNDLDIITKRSIRLDRELALIQRKYDIETSKHAKKLPTTITPANCVSDEFLHATDSFIDKTMPRFQRGKNKVPATSSGESARRPAVKPGRIHKRFIEYIYEELG